MDITGRDTNKKKVSLVSILATAFAIVIAIAGYNELNQPPVDNRVFLPVVALERNPSTTYQGFAWAAAGSRFNIRDQWIGYADWYHKWDTCDPHTNKSKYINNISCYFAFDDLSCLDSSFEGYIMFLNEPNMPSQCHMDYIEGADYYADVLDLFPNARLIGPAMSHLDYNVGHPWLIGFYTELEDRELPCPYALDIHTYIQYDSPESIIDSTFSAVSQFPCASNIAWVGEFGAQGSSQVGIMIDAFAADERIERIAYYAPRYPLWPLYEGFELPIDPDDYELTNRGEVWKSKWN